MSRLFLSTALLWVMTRSQFNIYDTYWTDDVDHLQFDCLKYYHRNNIIASGASNFPSEELFDYCIRPTNETYTSSYMFINRRDQNFTFDKLRNLNVTVQQLLSWSATIDQAERFLLYANQWDMPTVMTEIFFNCTAPWFGHRCQYSFDFVGTESVASVVTKIFDTKKFHGKHNDDTGLTCYMHLKCDRGGLRMCLDWREVCNGQINCLGGVDEAECYDLEMNECSENEYRCRNGWCIAKEFFNNNDYAPDCLDRSDEPNLHPSFFLLCSSNPSFSCEEHQCQSGEYEFPCGDGQCVEDYAACQNGRHRLLAQSISVQGNLSRDCWISMACLTKIIDRIGQISCQQLLRSVNLSAYLQSCESLFQFPVIPVFHGHVRFFYTQKGAADVNINLALTPDYVCYDGQLCDFLTPTSYVGNVSCRRGHEIGLGPSLKPKTWTSIIDSIKPYFRGCLTTYKNKNDKHNGSLYCCKNSSKCISKHKIVDGISDCHMNDDEEEFELSCSINDTYRFKCPGESKCLSPLLLHKTCPITRKRSLNDLRFHEICDRIVNILPVTIDGYNHSDESECEQWQCNNIYTRCDGFWNCPYGDDESNCTGQLCPPHSLPCVSPKDNSTLSCLPADRIDDGIVDCLGGSDERQYCLTQAASNSPTIKDFRCWNSTKCIGSTDLCNNVKSCPFNDDEFFCGHRRSVCDTSKINVRDNIVHALCQIVDRRVVYFSLATAIIYPAITNQKINLNNEWSAVRQTIKNYRISMRDAPTSAWHCNRGLYTLYWLGDNNYDYKCFCPPSYYGDLCQYQNQRVSLTLELETVDARGIYGIMIRLISTYNDLQEVNSYDQYTYVPNVDCGMKLNLYLLYSTRPKNSSKNYSVIIDAYDKTSLTYLASWHLNVPFLLLPVQRLAARITIPAYQALHQNNCELTCSNGECMKYANVEMFFCRCNPGWSGAHCSIPISFSYCSSDSICIDSIKNRSICICPLNKFGPRCLLTHSCPPGTCKNNGQCVWTHTSSADGIYACLCSEQFGGYRCEESKIKLEVSWNNIEIPSYTIVYLIALYSSMGPTQKIILQKLTILQQTLTMYTSNTFNAVFIKMNDNYYFTALTKVRHHNLSTSINPSRRCSPINELLNSTLSTMPRIRQLKYYHLPCQTQHDLLCFVDEVYMCLCTLEHHANCFKFDHTINFACKHSGHCQNGAACLQNAYKCPSTTICACTDCYFGDRCQFYAKGIGLTLDDILRYEIRLDVTLVDQTLSVKLSATVTMFLLTLGLIDSGLSFLTFHSRDLQKVGCGIYLLAASITSFFTITVITLKFWFLIFTHTHAHTSRSAIRVGCVFIEPLLRLFLYLGSWLNACVSIERAFTVFKGVLFNKAKSTYIAKRVIVLLPVFIVVTLIHQPLYRGWFDYTEERRVWCVTYYTSSVQYYNTFILFFHFLAPFCGNLFAALFIIFGTASRRAVTRNQQSYMQQLRKQFREHKNLIISPTTLVILSLPQLIISLLSSCANASQKPWIYLLGYFISFIPSILLFPIFVLPSNLYKAEFRKAAQRCKPRFHRK